MSRESKVVLLAEDDPDDRFLMKEAWREADMEGRLVIVEDGQAVIDYLTGAGRYADRAQFPLPHLLALDIKMPVKSGLEVLKCLRECPEWRHLPILMLTTSKDPGDVARAYELRANCFLVKPTTVNELVQLAAALQTLWLRFSALPERVPGPPSRA